MLFLRLKLVEKKAHSIDILKMGKKRDSIRVEVDKVNLKFLLLFRNTKIAFFCSLFDNKKVDGDK